MSNDYLYTRKEALKLLIDGGKMQYANCQPHMYFYYDANHDNPFRCSLLDNSMSWDMDRTKWRIYEEPKKLVEKWLWVARYKNDPRVELCSGFYSSEKELLESIDDGWVVICRADWSKIEVPE